MALLFGGRGNQGRSQPKNIVEFRAGKMSLKGNMVHPDKRKGQVYVYQSEDQLTHFCWKDRTSGLVEDDLIIFPDDAVFSKVTQCKEGSRVVLLKFKASSRKLFFWMQEPKADSDEDLISKVNEALNNPGGSSSSRGLLDSSSTPSEQEMQNLLSSMNQSQLMQLIGGMSDYGGNAAAGLLAQLTQAAGGGTGGTSSSEAKAPSDSSGGTTTPKPATKPDQASGTPAAAAPTAASKPASASSGGTNSNAATAVAAKPSVQLEDLQKILSGIQPSAAAAGGSVDLAAGVNTEFVKRITASPKAVQKLTPLLPRFGYESSEKTANPEEVVDTLISPAFQHALSSFCSAFPSGQLGPLIEQFEFGTDAVTAARNGNLEAFLSAIQKEADSQKSTTESPAEEQKPEDMNVD